MQSKYTPANRNVNRFAVFTAAGTFLLLIAGALVTSNDAGLSVPDWPLSYGSLLPPMVGGIFYEHGHRMIAAAVALLTTAMALWLWLRDSRRWVRWDLSGLPYGFFPPAGLRSPQSGRLLGRNDRKSRGRVASTSECFEVSSSGMCWWW